MSLFFLAKVIYAGENDLEAEMRFADGVLGVGSRSVTRVRPSAYVWGSHTAARARACANAHACPRPRVRARDRPSESHPEHRSGLRLAAERLYPDRRFSGGRPDDDDPPIGQRQYRSAAHRFRAGGGLDGRRCHHADPKEIP